MFGSFSQSPLSPDFMKNLTFSKKRNYSFFFTSVSDNFLVTAYIFSLQIFTRMQLVTCYRETFQKNISRAAFPTGNPLLDHDLGCLLTSASDAGQHSPDFCLSFADLLIFVGFLSLSF